MSTNEQGGDTIPVEGPLDRDEALRARRQYYGDLAEARRQYREEFPDATTEDWQLYNQWQMGVEEEYDRTHGFSTPEDTPNPLQRFVRFLIDTVKEI